MADDPIVCRRDNTSYTCIRVSVGSEKTLFITMADLKLERLTNREFALSWKPYEVYPVGRAAQVYLGSAQYREIGPDVREVLERILANPATPIELDQALFPTSTSQAKETTMSATETTPSEAPKKVAKKAAAAKKAAPAKNVAAKKPAKKAAPSPAAKKPAKKAAAPGKQAVAAVAKTLAKGGAKNAAAKPGRPPSSEKLAVIDPSAPRRGATAEYVAMALKLKTFTRQQLVDAAVAAGYEEKAARIKVADMVYFQVVGPA